MPAPLEAGSTRRVVKRGIVGFGTLELDALDEVDVLQHTVTWQSRRAKTPGT